MKLVILDRDGVINEDSKNYIKSVHEWHPIPGSLEAIARLNNAGFKVVVATNQSGVARGLFTIDALNEIHQRMYAALSQEGGHIDAVFFCPHGPKDGCTCRKPAPGLYLDIANRYHIDLKGVPVIGDSYRDIKAATAVKADPILVRTGKGQKTSKTYSEELGDVPICENLFEAVNLILSTH